MTTFTITYTPSGRPTDIDKCYINTTDRNVVGKRVANIIDAIELFEDWANNIWMTFENRNSIIKIEVEEA